MALSSVAKTYRDAVITLKDGTSATPLDCIVIYEDGDFKIDGLSSNQAEVLTFLDRGNLYSIRKGNQTFPSFSFTFHMTELSDATNENIWDFVRKTGAFAAGVSTYSTTADVHTLLIMVSIEGSDHGDSADHTLSMDDCYATISMAEGSPNKFTLSGTIYGTVTAT